MSFADVYDDVQKKKKQKEEKEKQQKKETIKSPEPKKEEKADKKKSKDGDKDISFAWWLIKGFFSLLFTVFSFVFPALSSLLRSLFGSKPQKEKDDNPSSSSSSAPPPGGQAKSPSAIVVNPFADDQPQSPKHVQRLLRTRARYPHSPFTPGPR